MSGILIDIINYKLNVDPHYPPVKQKKRSFAPERQEAIYEVDKLLKVGFIKETHYPD